MTAILDSSDEVACPACGAFSVGVFYEVRGVPVNSVLLLETKDEALSFPAGNIALGFCDHCGFVFNTAFEPAALEYSSRYESSQAYSKTFDDWQRSLAARLIGSYGLHNKQLIEIGCGNGEFLSILCELGDNTGVGFDPAYMASRAVIRDDTRTTFVADFYSEKYAGFPCDFVCCKMTLEHIPRVHEFVTMVRRSIGPRSDVVVFFQVPDVERILNKTAFWDVYFEHCSYFSLGSLARLFAECGFNVVSCSRGFDDQYIMIEAVPDSNHDRIVVPPADDIDRLENLTHRFAERTGALRREWRRRLEDYRADNRRVVVWGSSSKGVAFLTVLQVTDGIEYVVDINPNRQGFFMAGTGQEIVAPAFLLDYRPDVVIAMNPIYRDEISAELKGLDCAARLLTL